MCWLSCPEGWLRRDICRSSFRPFLLDGTRRGLGRCLLWRCGSCCSCRLFRRRSGLGWGVGRGRDRCGCLCIGLFYHSSLTSIYVSRDLDNIKGTYKVSIHHIAFGVLLSSSPDDFVPCHNVSRGPGTRSDHSPARFS